MSRGWKWTDRVTTPALKSFLLTYSEHSGWDASRLWPLCIRAARFYKGDATSGEHIGPLLDVQARWYRSLDDGDPDYSVYSDPVYIAELWACWCAYSRKYVRDFPKPVMPDADGLPKQRSILDHTSGRGLVVDMGNGFGYSTAALAELYPSQDVWGVNLSGTAQFDIASKLGTSERFSMTSEYTSLDGPVELLFASEFFEHIEAPIALLDEIVAHSAPRHMVLANTFGPEAIGHFREYLIGSTRVEASKMSRRFNDRLRSHGYVKQVASLWNDRPSIWTLTSTDEAQARRSCV